MERVFGRGDASDPTRRLSLVMGDITEHAADAIVNAANPQLAGGGGVDGAIHQRGGPSILEECRQLGGCSTGAAKATSAGRLPARHVIHAVGPVWQGGGAGEAALLASAYRESLDLATALGCRSVAFPSLSTGAYGYPIEPAAGIALQELVRALGAKDRFERLTMVLFSAEDLGIYENALAGLEADRD